MMYYNRTKGPLPVSLPDGTSTAVPPKGTITIGNGMTESITSLVRKGFLVPAKDLGEEVRSSTTSEVTPTSAKNTGNNPRISEEEEAAERKARREGLAAPSE